MLVKFDGVTTMKNIIYYSISVVFVFSTVFLLNNNNVHANDYYFVKSSADFFFSNFEYKPSSSDFDIKNFHYKGKRESNVMKGGSFSLGIIMSEKIMTVLDCSYREGDYEFLGDYILEDTSIALKYDIHRKDMDLKFSIITPFFIKNFNILYSFGQRVYETETKEYLSGDWVWTGNNKQVRIIDKTVRTTYACLGLGWILGKIGTVKTSVKGEVALILNANGEFSIDGFKEKKDSPKGIYQLYTFQMNMPLKKGSIFIDNGWHFQQIEFDKSIGEDLWYGYYGRAGFIYLF